MNKLKKTHKLFSKHTWKLLYHDSFGKVFKCYCGCVKICHGFTTNAYAYEYFKKKGMLCRVSFKNIIFNKRNLTISTVMFIGTVIL